MLSIRGILSIPPARQLILAHPEKDPEKGSGPGSVPFCAQHPQGLRQKGPDPFSGYSRRERAELIVHAAQSRRPNSRKCSTIGTS
jgi:hypothetical protein